MYTKYIYYNLYIIFYNNSDTHIKNINENKIKHLNQSEYNSCHKNEKKY